MARELAASILILPEGFKQPSPKKLIRGGSEAVPNAGEKLDN
jgi:hypothetical protein